MDAPLESRRAALVLVTTSGGVLGRLPPFEVETPWWQDVEPVVRGGDERFGLAVTILRLLHTALPRAHGGAVTYLAEVADAPLPDATAALLRPWDGTLSSHRLRQAWAERGGPAADLAWADAVLAARGRHRSGPAQQVRSWNLSSLWRVPTSQGIAWLKVVPPFFAHEGPLLARLAGGSIQVPSLLGHDGCRMLLEEIPGEDRYEAALPELLAMISLLVDLQREWLGRSRELLALGLPDWRAPALTAAIADVVQRGGTGLDASDRVTLSAFVANLAARLDAIAACGLPDSLVHGDFHPGNMRGGADRLVLLDWGDSGVGHPLLDQPAFLDRVPPPGLATVSAHWAAAWRRALPGCDPEQAAALLAPVAAARQAVIYQRFLDAIEPNEHPYHRDDVPDWLRRAAVLARLAR